MKNLITKAGLIFTQFLVMAVVAFAVFFAMQNYMSFTYQKYIAPAHAPIFLYLLIRCVISAFTPFKEDLQKGFFQSKFRTSQAQSLNVVVFAFAASSAATLLPHAHDWLLSLDFKTLASLRETMARAMLEPEATEIRFAGLFWLGVIALIGVIIAFWQIDVFHRSNSDENTKHPFLYWFSWVQLFAASLMLSAYFLYSPRFGSIVPTPAPEYVTDLESQLSQFVFLLATVFPGSVIGYWILNRRKNAYSENPLSLFIRLPIEIFGFFFSIFSLMMRPLYEALGASFAKRLGVMALYILLLASFYLMLTIILPGWMITLQEALQILIQSIRDNPRIWGGALAFVLGYLILGSMIKFVIDAFIRIALLLLKIFLTIFGPFVDFLRRSRRSLEDELRRRARPIKAVLSIMSSFRSSR